MIRYSLAVEGHMKHFFESRSQKDRRRYAAVEAVKLGHGGVEYTSLASSAVIRRPLSTAARTLADLPVDEAEGRVRKEDANEC